MKRYLIPLVVILLFSVQLFAQDNETQPLKISAFRDISAFILESANQEGLIDVNVSYVKNADEAHQDLLSGSSECVFMSYDDLLSLVLQDNNKDSEAMFPVHGGILYFCGEIDINKNKTQIGIDTNTGYARALRYYLHQKYPLSQQYNVLQWKYVGATNLRAVLLQESKIDATLLNPPYSFTPKIPIIVRMYDAIGPYQGVVANVNKSWMSNKKNYQKFQNFESGYFKRVNEMKDNPEKTMNELMSYYKISQSQAQQTYDSLWKEDGLNTSAIFNNDQLSGTEKIFSEDTSLKVPTNRTWIFKQN